MTEAELQQRPEYYSDMGVDRAAIEEALDDKEAPAEQAPTDETSDDEGEKDA